MKREPNFLGSIFVTATVLLIILALCFLLMVMWNLTLPTIIHCEKINFLQAGALLGLASLLTFDKGKLFAWLYE